MQVLLLCTVQSGRQLELKPGRLKHVALVCNHSVSQPVLRVTPVVTQDAAVSFGSFECFSRGEACSKRGCGLSGRDRHQLARSALHVTQTRLESWVQTSLNDNPNDNMEATVTSCDSLAWSLILVFASKTCRLVCTVLQHDPYRWAMRDRPPIILVPLVRRGGDNSDLGPWGLAPSSVPRAAR